MKALNRIVTALLALAVFPAAYLCDILTFNITSILSTRAQTFSARDIVLMSNGSVSGVNLDLNAIWQAFAPAHTAIITCAVFFALALLTALIIAVVAAVSNKTRLNTLLPCLGMVCLLGARAAFSGVNSAISAGEIGLSAIPGMQSLSALASLTSMQFSTVHTLLLVIFALIFIWNGAFVVITLDENITLKRSKKRK